MILLHLRDGSTVKIDPLIFDEGSVPELPTNIRRISIVDRAGKRVDLPIAWGPMTRVWVEIVRRFGERRGERVCYRMRGLLVKATFFYSDGRIVLDLDNASGF